MPAVSMGAYIFSKRNAPLMAFWELPALPPRWWPCPSELPPFCLLLGIAWHCLVACSSRAIWVGVHITGLKYIKVVTTLVLDLVASIIYTKNIAFLDLFEMWGCTKKGQAIDKRDESNRCQAL